MDTVLVFDINIKKEKKKYKISNSNLDLVCYYEKPFTSWWKLFKYSINRPIANKDFLINPDKIFSLINDKTRLLILNNPHNPTGSFTEKAVIDRLRGGSSVSPKKYPKEYPYK